ncbi:hypothetical protein INT45_001846 [Circinella minor]|uniref:MSP domain-containing protein n=1 Tax=Circinella minor TaxID=1195481 RepID=A0A8H7RTG3_9FUNG|nr:hypothetical protein INT45_001846 [Circinella minor]
MNLKQPKISFWKSLKSWKSNGSNTTIMIKKEQDDISSVLSSSASSSASSLGSYTKLKRLLFLPSLNNTTTLTSTTTTTGTGTTASSTNSNDDENDDENNHLSKQRQDKRRNTYQEPSTEVLVTSSSRRRAKSDKGILLRDAQAVAARRRERRQRQPSERVTFIEPSPVPRFRNAPPLPPASPPYLDIIMQQDGSNRTSIIQDEQEEPIIFTTPFEPSDNMNNNNNDLMSNDNNNDNNMTALLQRKKKKKRPHLCFRSPLQRGQTLTFTLNNVTPEEHIIVFKFLTSNAKLQRQSRRHSSASLLSPSHQQNTYNNSNNKWPSFASQSHSSLMERYFVRPSAGRMIETDQMDIMLFLNQVPENLAPNEILKDKILLRWAVIQRNTKVDAWIQAQPDSTRRKWLEMLVEQWPDQVIVRETRLKIRFV